MTSRAIIVCLAAMSIGGLAGCNGGASSATPGCPDNHERQAAAPASDVKLVKVVNAYCPIAGDDPVGDNMMADAELTRTYNGQLVGFCCGNCPPIWDKMSDAKKSAALKAAMAKNGS